MLIRAWIAVLALGAGVSIQDPSDAEATPHSTVDWAAKLPARAPIAGIAGFESVSLVRFAADPESPHELTCAYVFPGRVRWQLRVRGQDELGRHVEYRCGDTYFVLAQGQARADELAPGAAPTADVAAKCEMSELRRALFLWPNGWAWSGEGEERRAASECGRTLLAELGPDGRPRAMTWSEDSERATERMEVSEWTQRHGRWWPSKLSLSLGGELVWREEVEALSTAVALLDAYFVPPDRRGAASDATLPGGIVHVDTPARHEVRVPLAPKTDWSRAKARWHEEVRRVAAELPQTWRVAPGSYFAVDRSGAPTALWIRVRGSGEPPATAMFVASKPALLLAAHWPGADMAQRLIELERGAPAHSELTQRYVGFANGIDGSELVQFVGELGFRR